MKIPAKPRAALVCALIAAFALPSPALSAGIARMQVARGAGGAAAAPGILPRGDSPAQGTVLGRAPEAPDPRTVSGVSFESFAPPGAFADAGPALLAADAASEADVERALRAAVDADPAKYGVPSWELETVHVRRVAGAGRQADTIYAVFRQVSGGLELQGSLLSFTVKVIRGRPLVVASAARLYPQARVDATPRLSAEALRGKALEKLGPSLQPGRAAVFDLGRKIIFFNGSWHASAAYLIEGGATPVSVAVDMATGETFAWDPRAAASAVEMAAADAAAERARGVILGHAPAKGPAREDAVMADHPLPALTVSLGNGRTAATDAGGRFAVSEGLGPGGGSFSASLTGKWAEVATVKGQRLMVGGSLADGAEKTAVFNPGGRDEEAIAQVNGYLLVTRVHDWARSHGIDDARLDRVLPVNVNIDDECNAYYMPGRPSLNFFRSSEKCANSAYDTVVMHEYGHFVDDMIGGIVNSGLSEGWGDVFSMFILDDPVVGGGFYKKPRRGADYIRTGENSYQYGREDEAHDQGQAWGGFAWKLRKSLTAKLGAAAGTALAEALVLPVLFAKASNIPAAMLQVLVNDMDKDGNMPHEDDIRAAAKAHGIRLQKPPRSLATLVRRLIERIEALGIAA